MALAPQIETSRLRLVPFGERFLTPRYLRWLNDPRVVRFSELRHQRHTLDSCQRYLDSFRSGPNYFWAVLAKDLGLRHIGTMTAYRDLANRVADVGILLGETGLWGRGYGQEAFRAVVEYLLQQEGMRKVTAGTLATNQAMLRLMAKAGMEPDGRRRRHMLWEGQEVDIIYAARFAPGCSEGRNR